MRTPTADAMMTTDVLTLPRGAWAVYRRLISEGWTEGHEGQVTIYELADALNLYPSTIFRSLQRLHDVGAISYTPGTRSGPGTVRLNWHLT